jgi:hypothetical protein
MLTKEVSLDCLLAVHRTDTFLVEEVARRFVPNVSQILRKD